MVENASKPRLNSKTTVMLLAASVALWAVFRTLFFFGFLGYDDVWYYDASYHLGRIPLNHWECRLPFTVLIRLSTLLFGTSELAATLPSLVCSLGMLLLIFYLAWRLSGPWSGFYGSLLFALLGQDIFSATSIDVTAMAAVLISLGLVILYLGRGTRRTLLAGVFFGLSIVCHLYAVFGLLCAAIALFAHEAPRWRWKDSILLTVSGMATFLLITCTLFQLLTHDPFFIFKITETSHMPSVTGIKFDLAWFLWPVKSFFLTREFGLTLTAALCFSIFFWKRFSAEMRFLAIFSLAFFIYTNWGSQKPNHYLPLIHLPRYWLPIAVPVGLILGHGFSLLTTKWRIAGLAFMVSLQVLLLLAAGPWGDNVEVSKALKAYAETHPDQRFVADRHSIDEMYILNGCKPLPNVFSVAGHSQPAFVVIPDSQQVPPNAFPKLMLMNRMQEGRRGVAEFKRLAEKGKWTDIGKPKYRDLAYFLPESWKPRMLRHPAPALVEVTE